MDLQRARRVREIFNDLLDHPPAVREERLTRACGDDSTLRAEVASLLAADRAAGGFLETRPGADASGWSAADDALIGRVLGAYTLRRRIGVGGMGVVYEAEQASPRRTVALKLMRTAFASAERAGRFVREADVLARLQHPCVAQVFGGGVHHDAGVAIPYFAMEYVPAARTITDYADERDLDLAGRMRLFVRICEAVEHGHQRGVIHRDLKPGNILVDGGGRPRVIDFGVARLTALDEDCPAVHTGTGEIVGTLRYMSPEQCGGGAGEIDTRTDVYALGVVLYELLSGALPYDLDGQAAFDVPRIICEAEPVRLSVRRRWLRGDVETIVHKALEKDRDRRYRSVGNLASDIQRYLANEPIEARAASSIYVLRKSLARHRSAVFGIATAFVLMLAAAIALGVMYRSAAREHRVASERAESLRRAQYCSDIALAHVAMEKRDGARMRRHLDACPPDLRDWEWRYLARLADTSRTSVQIAERSLGAVYAPGGGRIAAWGQDGLLRLLDGETLALQQVVQAGEEPLRQAAFSPDGQIVATAGYDRTVRLWRAADGQILHVAEADAQRATSVVFSSDGGLVASGGWDADVKLWRVADGAALGRLEGGGFGLVCGPGGSRLYGISADGWLSVWDFPGRQRIAHVRVQERLPAAFAISPDGRLLSIGAHDVNAIRVLDADSLAVVARFECAGRAASAAFSADSRRLAVASLSIEVFDVVDNTVETPRMGHALTTSIMFSPDDGTLLSAGNDGTLRLWDAAALHAPRTLTGHTDMVRSVVAYPDGVRLATAARDGTIRVWDADTGTERLRWDAHPPRDQVLALDPAGRILASGGDDHVVRLWDAETGAARTALRGHAALVIGLAFSPDGERLASVGFDRRAHIWRVADGQLLGTIAAPGATWFSDVVFSGDGESLFLSTGEGNIEVRDAGSGGLLRTLRGDADPILRIARLPGADRIAATCRSGLVRIWRAESGDLVHELRGHTSTAQSLAFTPDGRRLVTGGYDGVVHVWDVQQGVLVLTLTGHEGGIPGTAVAADGAWLATASNDRTVRIWWAGVRNVR